MEYLTKQMTFRNKLKRYTIYPLLALGVMYGNLSNQSHAEQLDAAQIKQVLNENVIGQVTQSDKERAFKAFKEYAKKANFPKKIIDMVTLETISDHELYGNRFLMYVKDGMYITLDNTDKMRSYPAINRYEVTPEDIAEPLPPLSNGINTITKKPYFSAPRSLASKVSDKQYFKTLLKVMNTNFGVLMQFHGLDEKKIAKNEYASKMADKPIFYFGEGYDTLEQNMDETEIAIRRQLGFVVNGAVDAIKAGAKLFIGAGDCTGWTVHSIKFKSSDDISVFVVYNGISNSGGALPYYRSNQTYPKKEYLKKMQENFHTLMREHGVEPGTDVKNKSLTTPDQQFYAYLGNVLDNYYNMLLQTKALSDEGPAVENPKLKTLDKFVPKEIFTPVKANAEKVSAHKNAEKMSMRKNSRGSTRERKE